LKKRYYFIFGFLGLGALWTVLHWTEIKSFPWVLPSFTAKEACSCYFVSQRSEEECREFTRQYLPRQALEFEPDAKRVRAKGFGVWREAEWVSENLGCRLTAPN
jgi:hypothetical protein